MKGALVTLEAETPKRSQIGHWNDDMTPIHPEVRVRLTGESGHALFIMGRAVAAMRRAGLSEKDRQAFLDEATSGGYVELLGTVRRWFAVD